MKSQPIPTVFADDKTRPAKTTTVTKTRTYKVLEKKNIPNPSEPESIFDGESILGIGSIEYIASNKLTIIIDRKFSSLPNKKNNGPTINIINICDIGPASATLAKSLRFVPYLNFPNLKRGMCSIVTAPGNINAMYPKDKNARKTANRRAFNQYE
jgi:hypothetical protein